MNVSTSHILQRNNRLASFCLPAVAVLLLLGLTVSCRSESSLTQSSQSSLPSTQSANTPEFIEKFKVGFETADEVSITGRIMGQGDAAVILAHSLTSDQESWQPFAERLSEEDYVVLTFNFRGYPPSGGAKEVNKLYLDMKAGIELLESFGHDHIYLVGAGIGGTVAIQVAALLEVAGVVAISSPTSTGSLTVIEEISKVSEPKLFITSEGDASARESAGQFYEESYSPRILEVFRGKEHGTDMVDGEFGSHVQESILTFLEDYLQ